MIVRKQKVFLLNNK